MNSTFADRVVSLLRVWCLSDARLGAAGDTPDDVPVEGSRALEPYRTGLRGPMRVAERIPVVCRSSGSRPLAGIGRAGARRAASCAPGLDLLFSDA